MAGYYNRQRISRRRTKGHGKKSRFGMRMRPRLALGGAGVTTQHDVRKVYRKKTMPRYKKRRWIKFTRRVHAVAEKDMGTRTVVFNSTYASFNVTATQHGTAWAAIYPAHTDTSTIPLFDLNGMLDDLNVISQIENPLSSTAALGETVSASTKFLFHSAVLDLTVRNISTFQLDGVANLAPDAKLEIDVYEFISSKQWTDRTGAFNNPLDMFTKATANPIKTQYTFRMGRLRMGYRHRH